MSHVDVLLIGYIVDVLTVVEKQLQQGQAVRTAGHVRHWGVSRAALIRRGKLDKSFKIARIILKEARLAQVAALVEITLHNPKPSMPMSSHHRSNAIRMVQFGAFRPNGPMLLIPRVWIDIRILVESRSLSCWLASNTKNVLKLLQAQFVPWSVFGTRSTEESV